MPPRRKPIRTRRPVRKVPNPRPIPLDYEAIDALLDRLYVRLKAKADRYGNVPVNNDRDAVQIANSTIRIRTTRGEMVDVSVVLTAASSREVGFINGGGKGTANGSPVVVVEMNGLYSWPVVANERVTRERLAAVIAHELTHAADVFNATKSARRRGGDVKGAVLLSEDEVTDIVGYYNHPGEVTAYMREIHDEIAGSVTKLMKSRLGQEWGLGGIISRMLNSNPTWQQINPHLTPRSRKRILSGLVRAFRDDGL